MPDYELRLKYTEIEIWYVSQEKYELMVDFVITENTISFELFFHLYFSFLPILEINTAFFLSYILYLSRHPQRSKNLKVVLPS